MLISHQRGASKNVIYKYSGTSATRDLSPLSPGGGQSAQGTINLNSSISMLKMQQKRKSVFLSSTDLLRIPNLKETLNNSQASGANESRDISEGADSSLRGSKSRLLIQKDRSNNQIWVQRIPRLNASSDLVPPISQGMRRKVRAKAKIKNKSINPDSSASINADQLSQNDLSATPQQVEIPNNFQSDDLEDENIREDVHLETEGDQSSPVMTSKIHSQIQGDQSRNAFQIESRPLKPFLSEEQNNQDSLQNQNQREYKRVKIVRKRSNNNSQTRSQNNQDNPLNQPNPKPSPQNQLKDISRENQSQVLLQNANIQDYQLSQNQQIWESKNDLTSSKLDSEDQHPPKLTILSEEIPIQPKIPSNIKSSTPANNSRLSFMPQTGGQNSRSNSEQKKAKQYEKSSKYQQISNTKISRPLPPSIQNLNQNKQQPQGEEVLVKDSNEIGKSSLADLKSRVQGKSPANALSFNISSHTKNIDLNKFKETSSINKESTSSQIPNLKQQILMNREKREKERQQSLNQEDVKITIKDGLSQSNTLAANKQQHTPVKPNPVQSNALEQRQQTTSFPGENQRIDATPTQTNRKKRLPEDMYPKESLEQPLFLNQKPKIDKLRLEEINVVNRPIQPYNKATSMIQPSEQTENFTTINERMETSDFQSIDLMSVSNSIKQISPPQLPNMKQSGQSLIKQEPISSVNQSMYETPNFNLEDSTLDPSASQRLYVNLNKKISVSRPGTTTHAQSLAKRLMNKVESLNSIELLDQNSEISPPIKLMPTKEDLRGSVISLDNYHNMSVRFNDTDSELRPSRPQSRAVYQHQVIRPNNDFTSSPNNDGFESIIMNESYEESIRNRLLNHLRENNNSSQNLRDMPQTRNFTQSLVNTGGHPNLSNQVSRFPSFGVHNAPALSSNSQSLNQTMQQQTQGIADASSLVPSLLRYNKSNINLKEPVAIKDSPNADEEDLLGEDNDMGNHQNRINTLLDQSRKIKIVRKEPSIKPEQHQQIQNSYPDSQTLNESLQSYQLDRNSQALQQNNLQDLQGKEESAKSFNLKIRLNPSRNSDEDLLKKLKSPSHQHQELVLDPIREELEVTPKQKMAKPKVSEKFLPMPSQNFIPEPSPREMIQKFDAMSSNKPLTQNSHTNSQGVSIQSSPFIDMSQNKFFQLAKNKEMLVIGEDISLNRKSNNNLNQLNLQYSQSQNEQISEILGADKTQQLLTQRGPIIKNETKSQFEIYKSKAAQQNSDQKPKIKVSHINVMMDQSQQKSFDSMSSAMSNFTASQKQDTLKSLNLKKTTTEDVFSRLYNANNSNRNSKSPLRQSQTAGGLGQSGTGFQGFGNSSHFSLNQRVKGAALGSESKLIGSAERNQLKSIGAYNSMTYGIKPSLDSVARDFNPYSSQMRISDLKEDINAHFSLLKVESSPMNSTGSKGLMPIINNREKKVVKLNLDEDLDEQVSDNTSQNTLGRAFQPMASQIMYATHTPSDISFLESFQDSARRSQQYKLGKPKADNMSLRSSHASITLTSGYNSQSANSTAKKQIPRQKNTITKQPSLGTKNVGAGAQTTRSKQLVKRNQMSTTQSAINSRDHTPTASVFSGGARTGGESSKNQFRRNDSTSSKQKLGLHQQRNSLSKPRVIEHEVFFEPYQEKKVIPLLKEHRVKDVKPMKNQFSHTTRFF